MIPVLVSPSGSDEMNGATTPSALLRSCTAQISFSGAEPSSEKRVHPPNDSPGLDSSRDASPLPHVRVDSPTDPLRWAIPSCNATKSDTWAESSAANFVWASFVSSSAFASDPNRPTCRNASISFCGSAGPAPIWRTTSIVEPVDVAPAATSSSDLESSSFEPGSGSFAATASSLSWFRSAIRSV